MEDTAALLEFAEELGLDLDDTDEEVEARLCREDFWEFVRQFWETVPGAGGTMRANWHMEYLCQVLQEMAERVFKGERKKHDLIINIPPGTSKSTICSILFPAWVWTRMAQARIMTASHTDSLVMDLSNKTRAVVKSEKYRLYYPEIEMREDQDTKSQFSNTLGGDRYTCTVAGKSPMGFHAHVLIVDDPIDPKKALSEAELKTAREFMTDVISTRKVDKAVTITILIMQRLGLGDPTDVMVDAAKAEGAAKVKHVCLPAEDSEHVNPPELRSRYEQGLLDLARMDWDVLKEYKAKGSHFYETQFMQRPFARSGGRFKAQWFNKRIKAAPYHAARIRYWDRASTSGVVDASGACNTAGTLIAMTLDPLNFYIEDCVVGQWDPDERNDVMRATAIRDRSRYGPSNEPRILVEAEGGSSGRDAWKAVARALVGFAVEEDRVTGDKVTRSEPWASQLAAGNVFVVDNGEMEGTGRAVWDIDAYVKEHCAFPLAPKKDRVDSSTGAFNAIIKQPRKAGVRILSTRSRDDKKIPFRLVVLNREQLASTVMEERCILIDLADPPLNGEGEQRPEHGLNNLTDFTQVRFADIDPAEVQDRWMEPVPPWNKLPAELVAGRDAGKKIWSTVLKKRQLPFEVLVLSDGGDRRALSTALAIAEVLRIPRDAVFGADNGLRAEGQVNPHVQVVVKAGRGMVM